jgi:prevent-host-death family protein
LGRDPKYFQHLLTFDPPLCTQQVNTTGAVMAEQDKTPSLPPQKIGIREFRGNLPGFLRQVRQGSSFLVTSRGEVVALVQPPQPPSLPRRQPGTLRGKIRMAPDFDTLPDELLAIMESGEA